MNTTQFPWRVEQDERSLRVLGRNGRVVAICQSGKNGLPNSNDRANAKLIAAAPKLLKALIDLERAYVVLANSSDVDQPTTDGGAANFDGSNLKALQVAHAALAKAGV